MKAALTFTCINLKKLARIMGGKGYCIAAFKQVSDYDPVTKGNEKTELDDGTLVLLPMRSKEYGTSPDKPIIPSPALCSSSGEYPTAV